MGATDIGTARAVFEAGALSDHKPKLVFIDAPAAGWAATVLKPMKEMNIEFWADEWYDHHRRKVVWFTAIVDEKSIECGISIEALRDHFGAFYDDPLPAFRIHRERIQQTAAKLINQRRFEDDGTVLIRSADL